jgi:alkylation response protein AidB-like acyl-CoA dehydrogenase
MLATDLGLSGLIVPEQYGGLGFGPAEAAVVHEELGRFLYPGPYLATSLLTTGLLASEDADAGALWLPRIASGHVIGAVATADKVGNRTSLAGGVSATGGGSHRKLTGTRWYAIAAHVADAILVSAQTDDGLSMFLVESGAPGLVVQTLPGLDLTRRFATVTFEDCEAVLVGDAGTAQGMLDAIESELLIAAAAEAAGGVAWCLRTSVDHAMTREQFGRPIGSFQAVAHACVDMLGDRQSAYSATRYAAVAAANESPEALIAAHVAVLRSGEAFRTAAEVTIHLLGGTGFTWEHDAHLYFRRAWSAQQLVGRPQEHREAIATLAGL